MSQPDEFAASLVAALERLLARVANPGRLMIALSGGVDSLVLLHALQRARDRLKHELTAFHVDHALQASSAQWAEFCAERCTELGVDFRSHRVLSAPVPGQSVEAWARAVRYQALRDAMRPDDVILTAHHADDQAETFLLQALRGAGPHGLRGVVPLQRFGAGWLARPLLGATRREIGDYAQAQRLSWIDDPSNEDDRHTRNYLRTQIMPLLRERWPGVTGNLGRAAALQQTVAESLDRQADAVLEQSRTGSGHELEVSVLQPLTVEMQNLVLRRWIKRAGLLAPDAAHLAQIRAGALMSREDAEVCVSWKGLQLRRYRGRLFLMPALAPPRRPLAVTWALPAPLILDWGTLSASRTHGQGLSEPRIAGRPLKVALRRGGERCRPLSRPHSQTLKRLFQEWGIPPWRRDRLPLVFVDGTLAAVAGICVCHPFGARADEPGWSLRWEEAT